MPARHPRRRAGALASRALREARDRFSVQICSSFPSPGPGLAEPAAEPPIRPERLNKSSKLAQLCSPTWSRPAASKSSPLAPAPGCSGVSSRQTTGIPQTFLSPLRALPTRSHVQRPKRLLGICTRTRANTLGPSPTRKNTRKHVQGLRARPSLCSLCDTDWFSRFPSFSPFFFFNCVY